MNHYGDWLIMLVAGGLIVFWFYRLFYRWLHTPSGTPVFLLQNGLEPDAGDDYVRLLEEFGYTVTSAKHRIPIEIALDSEMMRSRLYIDYLVEKEGLVYLVKTARERMPMDWTGSGVRDRLLVYTLLAPHAEGVLFADIKEREIKVITFKFPEQD
ncbi:hypothetical protein EBB07_29830 [Paenibacillaceae bacterium]|nr:hypothetical protein EBB07_29830 [Paenibacillaceae bacterium]